MPMFEVMGIMIELIAWPFVCLWKGLQTASKSLYSFFQKPRAACPKCRRNLISDPGARSSCDGFEVLYSCQCGDWSRWRLDGKTPVYLGQPT